MNNDLNSVISEYVAAYVHANGARKAQHLRIEKGSHGWLTIISEGGFRSKRRKSELEKMTKRLLERPKFI